MSSAAFVFLDRLLFDHNLSLNEGVPLGLHGQGSHDAYIRRRLARLRAEGHTVVLISAYPEELVRPKAHEFGVREVIASRIAHAGESTSSVSAKFTATPSQRLSAVRQWAEEHDIALNASVGVIDAASERGLFTAVDHCVVVNPGMALLARAFVNRWSIEYWDRPEGVGSVFGREPAELATAALIPELLPGARFEVRGLDHVPDQGPAILACNHRSLYDAVAMAVLVKRIGRPVRVMAKAELLDIPVLGSLLRSLGVIGVDRDASPREAYRAARAVLAAGEVLAIMPEGTIPTTAIAADATMEFKLGAARLAARTAAPLIPVAISGTDLVWSPGSALPHVGSLLGRSRVRIEIGAALSPTGSVEENNRVLRSTIIAMLRQSATMDAGTTSGKETA